MVMGTVQTPERVLALSQGPRKFLVPCDDTQLLSGARVLRRA